MKLIRIYTTNGHFRFINLDKVLHIEFIDRKGTETTYYEIIFFFDTANDDIALRRAVINVTAEERNRVLALLTDTL